MNRLFRLQKPPAIIQRSDIQEFGWLSPFMIRWIILPMVVAMAFHLNYLFHHDWTQPSDVKPQAIPIAIQSLPWIVWGQSQFLAFCEQWAIPVRQAVTIGYGLVMLTLGLATWRVVVVQTRGYSEHARLYMVLFFMLTFMIYTTKFTLMAISLTLLSLLLLLPYFLLFLDRALPLSFGMKIGVSLSLLLAFLLNPATVVVFMSMEIVNLTIVRKQTFSPVFHSSLFFILVGYLIVIDALFLRGIHFLDEMKEHVWILSKSTAFFVIYVLFFSCLEYIKYLKNYHKPIPKMPQIFIRDLIQWLYDKSKNPEKDSPEFKKWRNAMILVSLVTIVVITNMSIFIFLIVVWIFLVEFRSWAFSLNKEANALNHLNFEEQQKIANEYFILFQVLPFLLFLRHISVVVYANSDALLFFIHLLLQPMIPYYQWSIEFIEWFIRII